MSRQICNALEDGKIRAITSKKAAGLVGQARLTPQDRHDIEHELIAWIIEWSGRYDSSLSPVEFFVAMLAENAGSNLLRHRLAAKRNPRRAPTSYDQADAGSYGRCYDRWRRDQEREDARLDFESLLARLSPADREFLLELRLYSGLAALAEAKGIRPSTMRSRFKALKRRILDEWKKNA